jgi:hypothetical protein
MFDKFISKYMKTTTDPAANVQEQLSQIEQTSGGVEGAKKKYGVAFKKGGRVKKMQKGGVTFDFNAANNKAMNEIRGNMFSGFDPTNISTFKNMNMADFIGIIKNPKQFAETAEMYKVKQRSIPGFRAYKKGGSVKKELKKITQVVKQGPKPKVNTKEISSDFKDFGVGVDPFDNKLFLYGAKKIGENIFATGGVKGEKDFYANVQKGNFNIGLDKQGSNKRITFGFEKKFNEGGLVSRGQGKARKKNFKIY